MRNLHDVCYAPRPSTLADWLHGPPLTRAPRPLTQLALLCFELHWTRPRYWTRQRLMEHFHLSETQVNQMLQTGGGRNHA